MRTIELLLVLFVACTIQVQLPNEMIRGVAITPSGPLCLADNATLLLIDEAQNIGSDWIFVNSYLAVVNTTSSIVFRGPQTPLNSVLQSYILQAQAKGLKVLFKPLIIPLDDSSWLHITPDNATSWFESYANILCMYADLIPSMDAISIGLELLALTATHKYDSYWLELIQQVRSCYSGILTYSALFSLEWERISFWNELDWIGIDEYLPVTTPEDPFPPVSYMTEQISNYFDEVRQFRISHNLTSKPVVLTELGCYSYTNATFHPANFPPGLKNCTGDYFGNFTTQQVYFEASFAAIEQNADVISGVFMYQ